MSLRDEVDRAIEAMTWLKPSDAGGVALARTYVEQIESVLESGDSQEVTKALYLGPHLLNTLRALGGTPAERQALGLEASVGGKLAQLRAISGSKK